MLIAAVSLYSAAEYGAGQVADLTYGGGAAKERARDAGYRDVELDAVDHGFVGFGECDGQHYVQYEMTATDAHGLPVELNVCKSILGAAELVREP